MGNFFPVFHDVVAEAYTFWEFKKYFYLLTYFLTLQSSYVQNILSRDKPKAVGIFNYNLEFLSSLFQAHSPSAV